MSDERHDDDQPGAASESGLSDAAPPVRAWYHLVIWGLAILLGAAGVVLGVTFSVLAWNKVSSDKQLKGALFMPVLAGGGGALLGVCLACAVAPTSFLKGPAGQRWMKLIGTDNLLVARAVCVALGLIACGVLAGLGWIMFFAPQK